MISHIKRFLFPAIWILSGFWLATQSATATALRGCNPPNTVELELYRRGTAPDETIFRKTIQNRRVVLMGVSTISADRMFGASLHVLPGLEDIQLEITNSVTQEEFGTHSQLFAKAYDSYKAILGHGDDFGKNVAHPRVWFIKDEFSNVPSIQTYLCGNPAQPHGEINIKATLRGAAIGEIKRTLTGSPNFANLLSLAAAVAEGTGTLGSLPR